MASTNSQHLQVIALPFGWEEGSLHVGLVTAHRSRKWTLPRISLPLASSWETQKECASDEALRQGGFLGIHREEHPLLEDQTVKGTRLLYIPIEIDGILDSWDCQRTQSRKMVPGFKAEKHLTDRKHLSAIRLLVERSLGVKVLDPPPPSTASRED
ncbi:MAG: hypothetical protein AAF191_09175 [Verrucomicrobiota bacterium]